MSWSRCLLVALLLVCPMAATAGSEAMQRAALPEGAWQPGPLPPTKRRQMALGLEAYWKDVADRIPRLSPAEKEWIEEELKTTDMTRLISAMNKREGALHMALDATEFCRNAYSAVVKTVGRGATVEALSWVHSLRCYASTSDLPQHLYRAGLISQPRNDAEIKMQLFSIWSQVTLRAIETALTEAN